MTLQAKPRVLLVDDNLPLLSALESLLQEDCDLVGRAMTVADLMQKAALRAPDVLVVDLHLPDGDGIEACRQVLAILPSAAVVILSAMDDAEVEEAAQEAGASAYVSKYNATSKLVPAILAAWAGRKDEPPMPAVRPPRRTPPRRLMER